jgi:hypothetical protein
LRHGFLRGDKQDSPATGSSHAPFKADAQKLLRFDGELHGELLQHFLGEAVDDQRDASSWLRPRLMA